MLLSGGQDSTTCLLLARDRVGVDNVFPVTFTYGQRHTVEVNQARIICEKLSIEQPYLLNIEALSSLGGTSLTDNTVQVNSDTNLYAKAHGLPSSVVPGRNLLFLTLAAAYGAKFGIYKLLTGGCLADYVGYPDCRPEFYHSAERTLQLALEEEDLTIVTPLTHVTKGDTFAIADSLRELKLIISNTHTCYRGDRQHFHDWGWGCGNCAACETRAKGWDEYQKKYNEQGTLEPIYHNIECGNYFL